MNRIRTTADLVRGIDHLHVAEPRFKTISARHGLPPLRLVEPGMASLLRVVTDQLISLQAGAAIWRRIETAIGEISAAAIVARSVDDLKAMGLSTAKARTFLAVAGATLDGGIDPRRLDELDDAQAIAALTALPGIGPWTAEIYLLTAMGRVDAWPGGDLALQVGAAALLGLPQRPSTRDMHTLAEAWRPYRAIAARLLWCHYRDLKGLPQSPI